MNPCPDCVVNGTGVMLSVELQLGKSMMQTKAYAGLKAATAWTLRLSQAYQGSNRIIYADSAFSSFMTARQCRKRGLHFTGIVKTGHRVALNCHRHAWKTCHLVAEVPVPPRRLNTAFNPGAGDNYMRKPVRTSSVGRHAAPPANVEQETDEA
eukprot:m.154478 g.154478  ORF g.154478 m.154478 type:complete len:153 (-) comp16257_c0_seq8:1125-1583(-)